MDAHTYGRLVEHGGYATGGTVTLGFDGSRDGMTSMVAYDGHTYTVIDEQHRFNPAQLRRFMDKWVGCVEPVFWGESQLQRHIAAARQA
jgi:hypothetical protein